MPHHGHRRLVEETSISSARILPNPLDLLITDLIEDGELEEFLLSKGIYPEPDYSSWLELAQQEGSLTLPWRLVADSDLDLRVA